MKMFARRVLLFIFLSSVCAAQNDRETAQKLMDGAAALAAAKTPASLHAAGVEFEQAARLWLKAGDAARQMEALYDAAWTHYPLHEYAEMEALLSASMDVARTGNFPAGRAELLGSFAAIHNEQGEFRKAIDEYAEARDIQKSLNNTAVLSQLTGFQANSWRMLGNAAEKARNSSAAIDAYRQAAALYQQAGDAGRAGQEYVQLAQLSERGGNREAWEQSAAFFTAAIPLLEAASDRTGLATAWWGLGSVTGTLGQPERSRDALLKVLPLFPDLKDPKAQGLVLRLLATAFENLGDLPQAIGYNERALPLFAAAHDTLNQYIAGMKSGKDREALGQTAEAMAVYRAAATATHAAGDRADEATALTAVGLLQSASRNWQAALDTFTSVQKLHAALGDKVTEANDWAMIGSIHQSRGEYRSKLNARLRSLALLEGSGDQQAQTQALIDIGDSYNALHQSSQALAYLDKARAMAKDDNTQMALVLVETGEVDYGLSRLDKALDLEQQALDLAVKLDKPAFVSRIRNDLALTLQAKGDMSGARKIFEDDLAGARSRNDVQQVYTTLHNLAKLHQDLGDNQESVKLFEESLTLARQDGQRGEAVTLDSLGTAYHLLGRDDEAVAALRRSLAEWHELGNENGESTALNNLALVYNDTGRPQQAIEAMNQALSKRRGLGDDAGVADLLRALGGIYQGLGDYDRAGTYLMQALETQQRFGDEHGQAFTRNSLGVLEMNRHEPEAALRQFGEALPVLRRFEDRRGEATVLSNIANALIDTGELNEAAAKLNQSLAIARETQDVNGQALALHGLGTVAERSGDLEPALASYRQALGLWRDLHETAAESKAHSLIAKVQRKQGKTEAALAEIGESIRALESQRGGLESSDLRAYFLASIADPYRVQIDLLMGMHRAHPGQGWDARAFEASERSRARSLLDLLAGSRIHLQGFDARQTALQSSFSAKAAQLRKVGPESADYRQLQLEIAELTAERETLDAEIRNTSPRYASLASPRPLTLSRIQTQVLDRQTTLLEYSLGEERSYLFAVTSGSLKVYELPRRADIETAARDLNSDLERRADAAMMHKDAAALSAILLGPAASQLKENRLMIVGDGELTQVPFAALPAPSTGQPLILTNEIVSQPSASTLAGLRSETSRRKKPAREIAVIADPVFEAADPRLRAPLSGVASSQPGFTRLDHSAAEARAILALAPASRSIGMLDFQANKPDVLDGRLAGYRIVHFATHGLIDRAHPRLSGLALSSYNEKGQPLDGFLDLNEIFDMKLQADLVVLSACESGGGQLVGGEGLMGLTRGFFYAGAASLVVSLWNVDDEATSELMKRFYERMLGSRRLRPAAALRAAQRSMILNSPWKDPYYWAAFTVQGEWR